MRILFGKDAVEYKELKEQLDQFKKTQPELQLMKDYKATIEKLQTEIKNLKLDKELEVKEIQHLVKMKEEKNAVELDKKKIEMEKEYVVKETARTDQYLDKILKKSDEVSRDVKDMTKQMMDRFTIKYNFGNEKEEKKA